MVITKYFSTTALARPQKPCSYMGVRAPSDLGEGEGGDDLIARKKITQRPKA